MELWIRSQDKENLLMVNKMFCHCTCPEMESIGEYYIGNKEWVGDKDYILLGKYKTKERALEVLDEIQNILKPKYILDASSIKPDGNSWVENGIIMQKYNANARIEELSTYVYEMPKE